MATARKEPGKTRTPAAAASRKTATGTRRKAEGIAVRAEKAYVVDRTGTLGGVKKPAAADTGAGKVKSATGGSQAVAGERAVATRGAKVGAATRGSGAGQARGAALGTKTGMKGRSGTKAETGATGASDSRMSRSIPVAEPPKSTSRARGATASVGAKKSAPSSAAKAAKTPAERARMAARVSTGPKGGGKLSTQKVAGAKKAATAKKAAGTKKQTAK